MKKAEQILDLNLVAWERNQGDITVIGTWTTNDMRPAMVLIPTHAKRSRESITPCVIPIDRAYEWDEYTGDPVHCAHMSFQFAVDLGFNAYDPSNLVRITSIIRDHLGDLLTTPPIPKTERKAAADVRVVDHATGRVEEMEAFDHV